MDRRERRQLRERRRLRHYQVWCILRTVNSYSDLLNSQNFYEYRENLAAYNQSINTLKSENIEKESYETACRFCQIEYLKGKCNRHITLSEFEILKSGNLEIDEIILLKSVIDVFKDYWDATLASYQKDSARKNRLRYLVEKLEDFKSWPEICKYAQIVESLSSLQAYYQQLIGNSNC